jgi:hypothetical protein
VRKSQRVRNIIRSLWASVWQLESLLRATDGPFRFCKHHISGPNIWPFLDELCMYSASVTRQKWRRIPPILRTTAGTATSDILFSLGTEPRGYCSVLDVRRQWPAEPDILRTRQARRTLCLTGDRRALRAHTWGNILQGKGTIHPWRPGAVTVVFSSVPRRPLP